MLKLKFWPTSSVKNSLFIEHSVIYEAENDWDECDKVGVC